MKQHRVTLADVAREAGVSVTTVSFVLSGREGMRITESTADRVRAASERLGYRPDLAARSLRAQSTMTLGLVSDTIGSEPYAGYMVRGAIEEASATSRMVILAETEDYSSDGADLVEAMLDRRVDGLMYGAMYTREVVPPARLSTVPHVFLNCLPDKLTGPAVIPDEMTAGRTAAGALLRAGHRDGIHHVGGRQISALHPDGIYAGHQRLRGIEEELAAAGIELASTVECEWIPEEGRRVVAALLKSTMPSALICANDRTAFGAYQALSDAGLSVPHDVSVVSFDDSQLAGWMRPGLTSVALPHREMGARAVDLLVAGDLVPVVHEVPMALVERGSIALR
ncbi:LacI family DNA-binding transcriptional regulator [Tsukamurella sp. PLM1]|uniref:LacI family DNA-binding transcriptional regulator n=1 Tax=Tsukamurella sp. PLM1 TaxID=2929795 RepID=UPI00206E7AF5|nr:LacI family DNA-binding transcriptional regulator [Tsukamurella sp. PLM1]BDH56801.1 alanine racemase [Tsukamurella sp. PLM1]